MAASAAVEAASATAESAAAVNRTAAGTTAATEVRRGARRPERSTCEALRLAER